MKKPKLPLNEIIHEGAMVCFDWVDYMNETPPDYTFGLDEMMWEETGTLDMFEELQKMHKDAVKYIKDHKMDADDFDNDFQEKYLNNRQYLTLSILGNKIEHLLFSQMTDEQIRDSFVDSDIYYTLEELEEALEFAEDKLASLASEN